MIIVLMTLFTAILGAETKVVPLPDLLKPETLVLDKTQMYVTEGTSIYIYSLKDFKLVKKFGKQGAGPQEFMFSPQAGVTGLTLSVHTEDIIVNSFGKISWFTKDGKFKKELKLPYPLTYALQPFGKNLVGLRLTVDKVRLLSLNLYNDKLEMLKEINKRPHSFQPGKGLRLLEFNPVSTVYEDKLFLAWETDFVIKVVDTDINELYTIKRNEKKRKVTEDLKKKIIDYFKTAPETKDYFEYLKPFHFPEYFPAIFSIVVTGSGIYVVTFQEDEAENDECLILDLKGKLLKRVFLPLKMSTPLIPHPYSIQEGVLYQVVENEEKEEWELHITRIN